MAYYRTCPFCGSNNDPDEICDCQRKTKEEAAPVAPGTTSGKNPMVSLSIENLKVKINGRCVYG